MEGGRDGGEVCDSAVEVSSIMLASGKASGNRKRQMRQSCGSDSLPARAYARITRAFNPCGKVRMVRTELWPRFILQLHIS